MDGCERNAVNLFGCSTFLAFFSSYKIPRFCLSLFAFLTAVLFSTRVWSSISAALFIDSSRLIIMLRVWPQEIRKKREPPCASHSPEMTHTPHLLRRRRKKGNNKKDALQKKKCPVSFGSLSNTGAHKNLFFFVKCCAPLLSADYLFLQHRANKVGRTAKERKKKMKVFFCFFLCLTFLIGAHRWKGHTHKKKRYNVDSHHRSTGNELKRSHCSSFVQIKKCVGLVKKTMWQER